MELRERRRADVLDRYWDLAQQGRETARPAEIDDLTAAVIRQLSTAEAAPLLTDAQDRVRARVAACAQSGNEPTLAMAARTTPAGLSALGRAERRSESRVSRPVAHLATAALILLALGLAFVALGPRNVRLQAGTAVPVVIEAPAASSSLPAEISLVEVAIPAAYLPQWQVVRSGFAHIAIPARSTSTWTTPALRLEYVLAGEYTVHSDGPSQVVRADATQPVDVATGTTIRMAPGDALLAPVGTTTDYATNGPNVVELLSWVALENAVSQAPAPSTWTDYNFIDLQDIPMVAAALTIRLQRVDLPPGSAWTMSGESLQLPIPADREYSIAREGEDTWKNISAEPSAIFVADVNATGIGSLMP